MWNVQLFILFDISGVRSINASITTALSFLGYVLWHKMSENWSSQGGKLMSLEGNKKRGEHCFSKTAYWYKNKGVWTFFLSVKVM